jgi:hypothetical protein
MRAGSESARRHLAGLFERPWNRFAAIRFADSLLRVGRPDEAMGWVAGLGPAWQEDSYFRHLKKRLPAIADFLESERWVKPLDVAASRNRLLAANAADGTIGTAWTTGLPQRANDWLTLTVDPRYAVRGIVLLSVPDFGHGPSAIELYGNTVEGETIRLGRHHGVTAPVKGWVAMRFQASHLRSITIRLARFSTTPWTVSESRLLLVSPEPDDGTGSRRPR